MISVKSFQMISAGRIRMKVGTLNDPLLLGTNNLEFYNDMRKM